MKKGSSGLAALALAGALFAAAPSSAGAAGLRMVHAPGTDAPSFVWGISEAPRSGARADAARAHLRANAARYGIDAAALHVVETSSRDGLATVRFQQLHDGVPVFGAEYLVHLREQQDGLVTESVNGSFFTDLTADVQPSLDVSDVTELVALSARGIDVERVESQGLTVLPRGEGQLTYHLTLWGSRFGAPVKHDVFVDADSGAIALAYNDLQGDGPVVGSGVTAHGDTVDLNVYQRGSVFEMRDRSRAMFAAQGGEIRTHDLRGRAVYAGTSDNIAQSSSELFSGTHSLSGAVDAHYAAGKFYEFFRSLGWNSLDNQGMSIVALVNAGDVGGVPMFNAFWDGTQVVFGNPDPREIYPLSADVDVVGHELTHGVTEFAAGLVFINQAGAMNEAYSDYFGNAIDVDASGTRMTESTAGYLGEDLCKVASPRDWTCPLRDLNDGTTTEDYVHYLMDFDSGGVHFNSTIYGGALWDIRETLGPMADRYVFRALTEFTTPLQDFFDGRNAVLAAARAAGATPRHIDVINQAFDARGITQQWDSTTSTGADATLVQDVAPIGLSFAAPQLSGSRFVIGDYADKTRMQGPLQIYVGRVDGSGALQKVGEDRSLSTYSDETPDISGKRVVWAHVGATSGGLDVEVHSRVLGRRVRTVARARGFQWYPSIAGKLVAWEDTRSGETDIWARSIGRTPKRMTGAPGEQLMPQVVGDWVTWWNVGGASPAIGMKNIVTGKSVTIRPSSTRGLVGPPGVGPGYVYWYEDSDFFSSNPDYSGSIVRAKLGSARKQVLVREGQRGVSPVWAGVTFPPPIPSANQELVTYSDEYGYAARFIFQDPSVTSAEVGRDIWVVPTTGGSPWRASNDRGDQAYPSVSGARRVVWLDSSQGRTDLVTRLLP